MIEVFRQHLLVAWSRAARSLDANRRRFSTFTARAVGAAITVPFLATPARAVVRARVAARHTLGYQKAEHIRRGRGSARL